MYLILALLAIAMAAGWIAQLIVGRSHGRTDWTEALIAGFLGLVRRRSAREPDRRRRPATSDRAA